MVVSRRRGAWPGGTNGPSGCPAGLTHPLLGAPMLLDGVQICPTHMPIDIHSHAHHCPLTSNSKPHHPPTSVELHGYPDNTLTCPLMYTGKPTTLIDIDKRTQGLPVTSGDILGHSLSSSSRCLKMQRSHIQCTSWLICSFLWKAFQEPFISDPYT